MKTRHEDLNEFVPVHTTVTLEETGGEKVFRVTKKDKIMQFDENTLVKLKDMDFHNGIIRVKMLSRLLPDAPDFARGFIGIVFRVNQDNSEFESFYIRPANGMTDDPVRRAHGCQYFSYPGYTFAYFREFGITEYEAPIHNRLNEWIQLTAVIRDGKAQFYLDEEKEPVLAVQYMKHGKDAHGSVGFFSEIGTEAFFKDLEIVCTD
jgi:hypothetical protein